MSFLWSWWWMQMPRNLALYKSCKAAITVGLHSRTHGTTSNWALYGHAEAISQTGIKHRTSSSTSCASALTSVPYSPVNILSVSTIHQDNNLERWSIQTIPYFTNILFSNSYDLHVMSPTTAGHLEFNPPFLFKNCCSNKINHQEKTLEYLKASHLFVPEDWCRVFSTATHNP